MTEVLALEGLSVDLPLPGFLARRRLNILDGISLSVAKGETLGIAGESGSGKSTLARAVMGLVPFGGGLRFLGAPVTEAAVLRRGAALMLQDSVAALSPRQTVAAALREPFAIARRPAPPAADLLDRVGLRPELARRYPHELSGGQARRVNLARALALGPKLLIADEPTAGLDVSVQGEVLNLIAKLQRERGLAVVLVSHNLAVLRHVADRIAVLYLGRLVETGPAAQLMEAPAHPYTASLLASAAHPDPRRRRADLAIRGEIPSVLRRPTGCVFHTRCLQVQDRCRTVAPVLEPRTEDHAFACHFPVPAT
ncbi:oligopeptide/dipeptide ABC transporter ATP-binding protein [Tabrizicola sp.]|uniref:oligopeptide/dipeptide ABC transporter ATP-binding protein n=1 Tax=Tabrizicola sp. TaxID=2005166 RepID=UPI003F3A0225